jgi:hypothetical protein
MPIETRLPIGVRIQLLGHFDAPVILEGARPLPNGYECRVRLADGTLEETVISKEEAAALSGGDHLGTLEVMPTDDGQAGPLVDALHRTPWLMEKRPAQLAEFLSESQVNREQLRLVAQALAGPALKGGELGDVSPTAEFSALAKLTANWQSVIEGALISPVEQTDQRKGQERLF